MGKTVTRSIWAMAQANRCIKYVYICFLYVRFANNYNIIVFEKNVLVVSNPILTNRISNTSSDPWEQT